MGGKAGATHAPPDVRFWRQTDISGGPDACWPWLGYITDNGYGKFGLSAWNEIGTIATTEKSEKFYAHRVSYELNVGPIPAGLQIDHLCRNRACVNPAHLEPVTCRENLVRGEGLTAREVRQTHCLRGHAFTEDNTRRYRGQRMCKTCQRDWQRRRWRAKANA